MHIQGPAQVHGPQSLSGPHSLRSVRPSETPQSTPLGGDRIEISEAGQLAARLAEIPDIRADRVAEIRAAITNGSYETDERLNMAVERLLDEMV